jgi:ATP-dependent DNA ligase
VNVVRQWWFLLEPMRRNSGFSLVASKRSSKSAVPRAIAPMEAKLVDELPYGEGWQYEPKWDGFRCLAYREGTAVELQAKSGKSLTRYFPEVVAMLLSLPVDSFVLDGELAIPDGETLSFDSLQMRLHPAESRVRKLAAARPALLILFDCLHDGRDNLALEPLSVRRERLERLFTKFGRPQGLRLSPYTRERREAERWLDRAGGSLDGIVAKRLEQAYRLGERGMLKVKHMRTADCVVGGFRYATDSKEVGSLLLGLYNDAGKLDHVGFTSAITRSERKALTKKLEALKAPPGFTGNAPGAPSRWSTERSTAWEPLKPKLVVEVRYDHVSGGRFRHGTKVVRWRPDKAPEQCTYEQLQAPARPGKLIVKVLSTGKESGVRR